MAFKVEDGSGVKGATSYTTEAFFRAYFLDRNIDVTGLNTTIVQALLIVATDYIDTRWGLRFLGKRRWRTLDSRSVFILSGQPADGEIITIDGDVFTFRTTATLDKDVEIGDTLSETLVNLTEVVTTANVTGFMFADVDVMALTIFTNQDGIVITTDVVNGSIDVSPTSGLSSKQQLLEFPRIRLRDTTGGLVINIPPRLQEATCEYAFRANSTTLAPDPTVDATGLRITGTRSKIGPIEKETTYAQSTTPQITKPFPAADRLLQEYIFTGGVIRA